MEKLVLLCNMYMLDYLEVMMWEMLLVGLGVFRGMCDEL